jgi:hypothetical protein
MRKIYCITVLLLLPGCLHHGTFEPSKSLKLIVREDGYDLWNPNLVGPNRICYQRSSFPDDTLYPDTINEIWLADIDGNNKRLVRSGNFALIVTASRNTGHIVISCPDGINNVIALIDTLNTELKRYNIPANPTMGRFGGNDNYVYFSCEYGAIHRIQLADSSIIEKIIDDIISFDVLPGDSMVLYEKNQQLYSYNMLTNKTVFIKEIGGPNASGFRCNPVYPDWIVHGVEGDGYYKYWNICFYTYNIVTGKDKKIDARPYEVAQVVGYNSSWSFDGKSLIFQVDNFEGGDPATLVEKEIWMFSDLLEEP